MNIQKAKEEIKDAVESYFTKDKKGEPVFPVETQRPIFVMGPPGIGKTAIMKQIADEMGINLVSYSMTHHTRQSALGLPYIVTKNYGGKEYKVSEYTMSEIIAAVYDKIEETGIKQGILFLDEVNCVSETLAPAMLQFLQFKTFGKHRIPDDWVVVTAGNPPEYNNSVREFDIVTWDRLKRIDVEPDFEAWKEYAGKINVHPAILSYLQIKQKDFYKVESTLDGKVFVTARGWTDLSAIIRAYEYHGKTVDEDLIGQYIQYKEIAKSFSVYYDLFNKYKSDYKIDEILVGHFDEKIMVRAKSASFDERLAVLGLLMDYLSSASKDVIEDSADVEEVSTKYTNVFKFVEECFGQGQEMLILVTELTSNYYCASFIAEYGCEEYFENNKDLMLFARQKDIEMQISELKKTK